MHEFLDFFTWYFYRSLAGQLHFINNSLAKIEDLIGITTNARYFFTPIYGDKTWVGRSISLFTRSSVIIFGAFVFMISSVILISVPFLWIISLILLFKYPVFVVVPITAAIYYLTLARKKPFRYHPSKEDTLDILPYCNYEAKVILTKNNTAEIFQLLKQSPDVKHFIQRTLLPIAELWQIIESTDIHSQNLLTELYQLSREQKLRYVRPTHIFAALLLLNGASLDPVLKRNNLDIQIVHTFISWDEYEFSLFNPPELWDSDYHLLVGGGTNRTWQGTVTPILNQYGYDLNSAVLHEPNKVIRNELINEMEKTLQKSQNSNILLIGEIGVGKDTLVREIAQWINTGATHGPLWSKRIIDLDIGRLFAGATSKGAFEERVESVLDEVQRSTNIILYLNDFRAAIETKTGEGLNLFSLLQKPIASGNLKIIGAITPKELKVLEQTNPLFLGQFTPITVPETDQYETTSIIHSSSLQLESRYRLFFPYPNLDLIVKYARNYIHQGFFPEKALTIIEDIAVGAYNDHTQEPWKTRYGMRIPVLKPIIDKVVTSKTTIPVGDIQQNEAEKLLNLEIEFKKYIVDQTDAVHALSEVMRRNRSGLRNANKPIGTFLFVGPTGVGKTEMAKTLAKLYFGSEKQMVRLDMSEYQAQDSIDRIIGSSNQNTNVAPLTEIIRKQPYSLILLDELEKAHSNILDLFLQVLDDARLTDAYGSTVAFNETIIIATSNAGTQEITKLFQTVTASDQYEHIQKEIYHILAPYFRTEFLNRFDDIILFKPLTKQSIEKVVRIQLEKLTQQLYENKKITITFSGGTIDNLVKNGYNVELGARPLQRTIQNQLESKIANMILEGKLTEGQTIEI
ncbi:MAG: ATP-dependent Clp protease ATP-binding subunit [bacterium]|nr:ATP-dependent Clp protease ATP-binding subunit [bacterium]